MVKVDPSSMSVSLVIPVHSHSARARRSRLGLLFRITHRLLSGFCKMRTQTDQTFPRPIPVARLGASVEISQGFSSPIPGFRYLAAGSIPPPYQRFPYNL